MIDASIPLQVKQFDLAGSFQNGQALRMNQMKMQEAQQELADKRLERQTYAQMFANPQSMDPANRQQTIGQIGQHNPELAFKLQQHFATMDSQQRAIEKGKWEAAGPVLQEMRTMPAEQRAAFLQHAAPSLMAAGWTPDDLQKVDLSDESIHALATTAHNVQQVLDSHKIEWHQIGENGAFATDYDGNPTGSGNPFAPGAQQTIGSTMQPGAQPTIGDLHSYKSAGYDAIESPLEQQYGLPHGLMASIRTRGERSNSDQVSSAGAQSVYQITPQTRQLFLNKYGVDAYASPQNAAQVAALHLRDSIARGEDPVRGYIGGPDKSNWGDQTQAYAARVNGGQDKAAILKEANDAIARGADRAKVTARLRAMGVVQ
jgi:hypothetical protein